MLRSVRLSVRLSICPMLIAQQLCVLGLRLLQNTNRNPRVWSRTHCLAWPYVPLPRVVETATKPSPAPLRKHSLGGCTRNRSLSIQHLRGMPRRTAIVWDISFRSQLGDTLLRTMTAFYLLFFVVILGDRLTWAFAFLVACHCALHCSLVLVTCMFCTVG